MRHGAARRRAGATGRAQAALLPQPDGPDHHVAGPAQGPHGHGLHPHLRGGRTGGGDRRTDRVVVRDVGEPGRAHGARAPRCRGRRGPHGRRHRVRRARARRGAREERGLRGAARRACAGRKRAARAAAVRVVLAQARGGGA